MSWFNRSLILICSFEDTHYREHLSKDIYGVGSCHNKEIMEINFYPLIYSSLLIILTPLFNWQLARTNY